MNGRCCLTFALCWRGKKPPSCHFQLCHHKRQPLLKPFCPLQILPGLQSFCVCCAIGIASIYLLQASWFVAWMSIDQRRIAQHRDGLAPCYRHTNWTPSAWSTKETGRAVMAKFAKLLKFRAFQVAVIAVAAGAAAVNVWGSASIRQEFDPVLLLPAESYMRRWIDRNEVNFPANGWPADIYAGNLSYTEEDLEALDRLTTRLEEIEEAEPFVTGAIDVG